MNSFGTVLLIMSQMARAAQFEAYLRAAGAEVLRAESGLHALTQLERTAPDAIVCAAQLEDMSGRELLAILRDDSQFREVVFLLLDSEEDDEFGIHDAAIASPASPAQAVQELLPVLLRDSLGSGKAVEGNLEILGLDGLLSALTQGRRSGRLEIFQLSCGGELWLSQGQLINARYGYHDGEEAAIALLQGSHVLLNADYAFYVLDVGDLPRVIDTPTRTLLQRAELAGPRTNFIHTATSAALVQEPK
ncbi:response regulator [Deinococcus peraridilitoris]|uniref:Response regulator containing a CheY-like receiver domain and a GGDEF domain protein n=1 Tax=Deinococcus peraridilitoris (strain DSM 19664 / LMG 22246 / CIP 109416 / KR-200) TaxID=937777 RepID=K9ZXC8_DEIPD|nr:response regulator [Deinococcus peraridilitoris]AFZ65854.1 response regulator containing a CheY-like receiver domain and a GGDEF domain protein [Deinococcus peraridilitoris DSM 19664]